jgi:acyl carrier protein
MTPHPDSSLELTAELRQIVAENGGIAADFNPQAHFYNDLGIPSVKALHLLIALEERYGISINDQDFVDANSLENLQALMGRLLNR